MNHYDLVIVGAGPAGLSAGVVAAKHGLHVTILDEFPMPGGRLLGQFHEEPGQGWWIGRKIAEQWVKKNQELGVALRCGVSVTNLEKKDNGWSVDTTAGRFTCRCLLLATGAAEVPVPIAGWTLPGVMSIGAAQVLTNVHYVKPGKRGLIIGINVLSLAIARELVISGVELAGIVLPPGNVFSQEQAKPNTPLRLLTSLSHLAPSPFLRLGGKWVQRLQLSDWVASFFPRRGIKVWDIPLRLRTAAVKINGDEQVKSVTLQDVTGQGQPISGSQREEKVDFVALAGGLYPLAELAALAGVTFAYIPELGGQVPLHSEWMETTVPGLYVAGNITGIESAQVAMAQGKLAATSICHHLGVFQKDGWQHVVDAMQEVKRVREQAMIQFHPGIPKGRQRLYDMWQEAKAKV